MFAGIIRTRRARLLGGFVFAMLAVVFAPAPASAHAPDEYGHNTYLHLDTNGVGVEMHLTPGPLVGWRLADLIDTNGNGSFDDQEKVAYGNSIAQDLVVVVDGSQRTVTMTSIVVGTRLDVQAGSAELVWTGLAVGPPPTSSVQFADRHQVLPGPSQVSLLDNGGLPSDLSIDRSVVRGLRLTGAFSSIGAVATTELSANRSGTAKLGVTTSDTERATSSEAASPTTRLQSALGSATSPGSMAIALGIAAFLGALHALTPGHGKTIAGAYLVGEKATIRHAVILGGSVTVTHTASVLLLGVVTIRLADQVDPGTLTDTLRWASGLLVVVIGITLLVRRLGGHGNSHAHGHSHDGHGHSHGHSHAHSHSHDGHSQHTHENPGRSFHSHEQQGQTQLVATLAPVHSVASSYDDLDHVHAYQPESKSSVRRLVTLGASGGLVPCPEALGVLIVAVSLRRQAFGMAMIVSFSLGLAAVLIAIGIALVRARLVMNRFATVPQVVAEKWLPVLSALVVTLLGIAILSGHVV